ncbi:Two-component system sensor histidine kinase involved in phosphate regulation [Flavobacterium psychrophilum]|jgi:two-component system phosphate regulon sensor histidine kinase PhoR|uniref:sensor histidine kinase n=1 Tax=Flavobacterium psychrophilum TaxID=96345 RepID=UPI000B7C5368|nr:ATP-binding protein [Flavobacterium psychrophilum]MCB6061614.1 sensor histidine kinase [Flavobacterium psychrophilum]SNB12242.1 Two-component system sensor histidine kinase involved in phosphate regulation [Flavobacterium psychrophilum]SNB41942.1 Two-component system sensor histidine kinase involved in phosphate regulation [Flavobacterium psychrophilum]
MNFNFKKTYKFAVISALYITIFAAGLFCLLDCFFMKLKTNNLILVASVLSISIYIFALFLMQYRTEKFIYQRVKKLYEEISFLDTNSILNQPVNSDLSQITTQVQQFAANKKLEIESLNDREEFRREFLGNVSHELKTPLFTVQGYISTLLDGAMKDKIIRKKYLERAEKGVERLIYIVEDLDTIAKLEIAEGRIEMTNFDIISLIQGVFDLLEMKANKKEIMLSFDSKYHKPIMVLGNYEKIQQVVTNLVENSIKYGKIGGSTEIGVEEVINNKILINVKDNGEGIEKQNISRLFERFYRVDKSGSRSEGGSGLGLAIVKHIIEAHNERIFVESKFRVGSEFSFTLQKTINQK